MHISQYHYRKEKYIIQKRIDGTRLSRFLFSFHIMIHVMVSVTLFEWRFDDTRSYQAYSYLKSGVVEPL